MSDIHIVSNKAHTKLCLFCFFLPLLWWHSAFANCPSAERCNLPPGLFIGRENLEAVKIQIGDGVQPFANMYELTAGLADAALLQSPNPFFMDDISQIEFGWCGSSGGADDTFKDLTDKLDDDSSRARNLALAYLFSGDERYARKARDFMLAWATGSTLLNMYDLEIDFTNATFIGIEDGYCNNSWNMALDSMWQAYGLINFSDTYAILTRNNFQLPATERKQIADWLLTGLLPATNAGFHAWTRWADAHPNSSAYTRYRSDNHISWSLAGIAAAAAALNNSALWDYAVSGGAFDDGYSGPYANTSNLRDFVGRAIYSDGEVYDEQVRASQHKGLFYAHFSMWALSVVAQIAEVHKGENYWTYEGAGGGSIAKALDRYAPYVSGDLPVPDPEESVNPASFRHLYEMVVGNEWVSGERQNLYIAARNSGSRNQVIKQAVGPVALVTAMQGVDAQTPLITRPKKIEDVDINEP